ncbi:uncharacterized protein Z518_02659 [Rhinocladiella mackenziei CBS 650.93]|uniref:Rhinocladiella mackenziei CBS 650.93 unplaced genomic scaffold supercont1.2, whole genome shotgun sequence n=1 Tax=Rhinocladiella mackenziei CBS 650.93 TaxID=1442369 RepID=A0A0D2IQ63_9EURO|nr:uncharacterized protein Z518_02659 [Rhinocladiella mackenziei CBS 650.93]KIX08004.1 hypothetical protein Z518_02659 [Rhinocladiella mackenziei CBS 650.93]
MQCGCARSLATATSHISQRIHYQNANNDSKPNTTAWKDPTDICANDDLGETQPSFSIAPPAKAATDIFVDINFAVNATGSLAWIIDNSTFGT